MLIYCFIFEEMLSPKKKVNFEACNLYELRSVMVKQKLQKLLPRYLQYLLCLLNMSMGKATTQRCENKNPL